MGAEILNEDEILVALSKVPGTDDVLSKSEKAKILESIKKLNKKVRKKNLCSLRMVLVLKNCVR